MNEELLRRILGEELKGVKEDIGEMKAEITGMKTEITGMKTEITGMKERLDKLEEGQASLRQEIKQVQTSLKQEIEQVQTSLKQDIKELDTKVDRIEKRQEAIFEEVGGLMEFRTDITQKIKDLAQNIEYVQHKNNETEKEVLFLKRKIL